MADVAKGRSLFLYWQWSFGDFTQELYHRAGGASFIVPVAADYLLPTAGLPVVRVLSALRCCSDLGEEQSREGRNDLIASQSGINGAVVECAEAKMGLTRSPHQPDP